MGSGRLASIAAAEAKDLAIIAKIPGYAGFAKVPEAGRNITVFWPTDIWAATLSHVRRNALTATARKKPCKICGGLTGFLKKAAVNDAIEKESDKFCAWIDTRIEQVSQCIEDTRGK